MKKVFMLSLMMALMVTVRVQAQTYFSSESRILTLFNFETEEFETIKTEEFASMFILNDNESIIKHITSDMTSSYYVQKKTVDGTVNMYDVISDVGNSYIFAIDIPNNQIRILMRIKDKEGREVNAMYVFVIKRVFRTAKDGTNQIDGSFDKSKKEKKVEPEKKKEPTIFDILEM